MNSNHVPPQNIEAEMSILGAVFVDNGTIDTVHGIITCNDFYRESHRVIFSTMAALADKHEPIDIVTMNEELRRQGALEQVGGGAYLAVLVDYTPTSANIAYYCRIVAEMSAARRLITHAQSAIAKVYERAPLAEIVSDLEAATQMPTGKQSSEPVSARDVLRDSLKAIEKRYDSKGIIQGIAYGIPGLDEVTSGMHRGDLIVVAGRPSMGKTSFALNALESACTVGLHGLLFSLEMSRQNNMDKILASKGKIKYQRIRNGSLEGADWERATRGADVIANWPLYIDDTPGVTLRDIRTKARRMKKKGLDLMVVDYLQLMTLPTKDNRVQALGEVSRGLKLLARELDIVVIALSQLNRSVDSRQDKRPVMSDLRDSGEIEQDADVILFPFRPAAYCQECRDRVEHENHSYREHNAKAEIIVEKQRNGERNISIPAVWLGDYQRFEGLVNHYD